MFPDHKTVDDKASDKITDTGNKTENNPFQHGSGMQDSGHFGIKGQYIGIKRRIIAEIGVLVESDGSGFCHGFSPAQETVHIHHVSFNQ